MEEKKMSLPLLGDKFPRIEVKTTHGVKVLPDNYAGQWFVLFSHPGDFTPVCTTEFITFSEKAPVFAEANTALIGLSVDQLQSHLKWVEWINENSDIKVPFPIIADELGLAAKKLGMLHEAKGTNTVRAVFIVDDKGILRLTMFYPQEIGRNVNEIIRSLRALQLADESHVAVPENFPNNSFIGKNMVIIPPPTTEAEIQDRKKAVERKEYECKDWWFCFRRLCTCKDWWCYCKKTNNFEG